ncbi:MAG: hypothetical protein JW757_04475 [Anaerolineales bacterium]|nr:hypothetical protein [Anaerolineales bacterium]
MELFIFDMDGVLLKPQGYHRALQDTVRLASLELGLGEAVLTNEQIAQFEALGISSEWHSSALCISALTLAANSGRQTNRLDLDDLFQSITAQPISIIPRKRGEAAITQLAETAGIPPEAALDHIQQSEHIHRSLTLNLFQSMILGDEAFFHIYRKPARMQTASYLKLYDHPVLTAAAAASLTRWVSQPGNGAAIMTNRPSYGPDHFLGAPDAAFGAELVGLVHLPLIGYGETSWLANQAGKPTAEVSKPNPEHALAAILTAAGWEIKASLQFISRPFKEWDPARLSDLRGSQITVFEDTPAGVIAAQAATSLLNQIGLEISVRKIGIAVQPAKINALQAVGAEVSSDLNQALAGLNHF